MTSAQQDPERRATIIAHLRADLLDRMAVIQHRKLRQFEELVRADERAKVESERGEVKA